MNPANASLMERVLHSYNAQRDTTTRPQFQVDNIPAARMTAECLAASGIDLATCEIYVKYNHGMRDVER